MLIFHVKDEEVMESFCLTRELSDFNSQSLRQSSWGFLDIFMDTSLVALSDWGGVTQKYFSLKKAFFITCVLAVSLSVFHMYFPKHFISSGIFFLDRWEIANLFSKSLIGVEKHSYQEAAQAVSLFWVGYLNDRKETILQAAQIAAYHMALRESLVAGLQVAMLLIPVILLTAWGLLEVGQGGLWIAGKIRSLRRKENIIESGALDDARKKQEFCRLQLTEPFHQMINYLALVMIVGLGQVHILQGALLGASQGVALVQMGLVHTIRSWGDFIIRVQLLPTSSFSWYFAQRVNGGVVLAEVTRRWVEENLQVQLSLIHFLYAVLPFWGIMLVTSWIWDRVSVACLTASHRNLLNKELCRKKLYSLGINSVAELERRANQLQKELEDYSNISVLNKMSQVHSTEPVKKLDAASTERKNMLKKLEELRWLRFLQPIAQHLF